jgi:hypothetical protein
LAPVSVELREFVTRENWTGAGNLISRVMNYHSVICGEFRVGRYVFIHEVTNAIITINVPYLETPCRETGVIHIAEASSRICVVPFRVQEDPCALNSGKEKSVRGLLPAVGAGREANSAFVGPNELVFKEWGRRD